MENETVHALTLPMTSLSRSLPVDDDAILVAEANDGDREAFERLVERHQNRVFRLAGRFFRHREDVEEAAQDTFLTAWTKLGTYKAKAPFEHWLTRVCLNTCYMRLRREKPQERLPAEIGSEAGDPNARLDAERLLARLEPRDRFILQLLHGEGWSTTEIAAQLGWTVSNVKVRAFRARRRLRQLVEAG